MVINPYYRCTMDTKLQEDVEQFLDANFPQIEFHGGNAEVTEADISSGHVSIRLTGACNGCGISPMTIEAIKRKLFKQIDIVESISVQTGEPEAKQESFDAPF